MIQVDLIELSKIEILRLIHLFTCLFGGLILILTWRKAISISEEYKQDLGLLFISCALFLWVAMDLYRFIGFMKPGYVSLVIKTFSAYNNGFFIASLPFFSGTFIQLRKKVPLFDNKTKWALTVLLINIGFVFFYSMFWGEKQENSIIVNYFDFIYSTITYVFLGYAIVSYLNKKDFYKNNMKFLAMFLTFLLITVQIGFAPFFKISFYDVLSASAFISQTLLIFIFIFISQSWINEIYANIYFTKNKILKEENNHLKESQISMTQLIRELNNKLEITESEKSNLQENLLNSENTLKITREVKVLSERELEVLSLIDKSYTEIGKILFISRDTVITHKKNIESKLGLNKKEDLILYAINNGLIKA